MIWPIPRTKAGRKILFGEIAICLGLLLLIARLADLATVPGMTVVGVGLVSVGVAFGLLGFWESTLQRP